MAHSAEVAAYAIQQNEPDVDMVVAALIVFTYFDGEGDLCRGFLTMPEQDSITTNGLADLAVLQARSVFSHEG